MNDRSIEDEIRNAIEGLSERNLRRVLDYARSLSGRPPRGVPGESLLPFLGSIPTPDIDEMADAIKEGCEGP